MTSIERFWAKVNKTEGCWLWTPFKDKDGYGLFWFNGRNMRAHRFAYELLVRPIPAGLTIDHLCRTSACVKPSHMEPVTNKINVLRGVGLTAQNARLTVCPKGHLYDLFNTRYTKYGRECKACKVERNREWRKNKRVMKKEESNASPL